MDTITRHWHMLRMIPRHPRTTDAPTLHDRLEAIDPGLKVSRRTVERDLNELSTTFPLLSFAGRPQKWCWAPDAEEFDVPGMDLTSALTFRMVGEYLGKMLPAHCFVSLAPQMKRADQLLTQIGDGGLASWPDKVRVVSRTMPLMPPPVAAQVMEVVSESLLRDRCCRIAYRKRGEVASREYVVHPLGLVFNEPLVYLVAAFDGYSDPRLLALNRIERAESLDQKIVRPKGFRLQEYVSEGALGFPEKTGRLLRLKALFTAAAAAHLYESPLSVEQKMTEKSDGRILVDAEVADTPQLRWWLLGFGSQVEVLGPKGLREEFAQMAREMTACYG